MAIFFLGLANFGQIQAIGRRNAEELKSWCVLEEPQHNQIYLGNTLLLYLPSLFTNKIVKKVTDKGWVHGAEVSENSRFTSRSSFSRIQDP